MNPKLKMNEQVSISAFKQKEILRIISWKRHTVCFHLSVFRFILRNTFDDDDDDVLEGKNKDRE